MSIFRVDDAISFVALGALVIPPNSIEGAELATLLALLSHMAYSARLPHTRDFDKCRIEAVVLKSIRKWYESELKPAPVWRTAYW